MVTILNSNESLTIVAKYDATIMMRYKEEVLPSILKEKEHLLNGRLNGIAQNVLNMELKETSVLFFTSFISSNIHVGSTFNYIFEPDQVDHGSITEAVVLAILEEWTLLPLDSAWIGHRCDCFIDFPKGIPDIVNNMVALQNVTSMHQFEEICLSNCKV